MQTHDQANTLYAGFNLAGVLIAYGMLALSIWLSDIPLSTKGYWGMGVLLLTLSLVNFVKYRIDERTSADRINKIEAAKNEKILEELVTQS